MVSHNTVSLSTKPSCFVVVGGFLTDFSLVSISLLGCKVEMFDLKVEAVNTHRDRPLVPLTFKIFCHMHSDAL